MNESKRFAKEAQALLSLDHMMIQRQYAMMCGTQAQAWQEAAAGFPSGNALGLTMDHAPVGANGQLDVVVSEESDSAPPPAYGPPSSTVSQFMSTGVRTGSVGTTPTSSILLTGYSTDGTESTAPATPTPTRTTFVMEETTTRAMMTTKTVPSTTFPMQALAQVHRAQDVVDAAADEATLRGTLAGALDAKNDVDMVRCLQVARGEIPEAAETLRRTLSTVMEAGTNENKDSVSEDERYSADKGNTELDRKFIQSGIEAMARLANVIGRQPRGEETFEEGVVTVGASKLPSWTITR